MLHFHGKANALTAVKKEQKKKKYLNMTILINLPFYFSKKLLKCHINLSRPFFSKTVCAVFKSTSNKKREQVKIQATCVKKTRQSAGLEYSSPITNKEFKPFFFTKLNPVLPSTLFCTKVNPRSASTFFPCVKRTRIFLAVRFFSSFFDKDDKQQKGHLLLKTEEIFEKKRGDWLTRKRIVFRLKKGHLWPSIKRGRISPCFSFNKKIAKKAKKINAHALNEGKKSTRRGGLSLGKKASTFATNNGIPIQNRYGHRVKVKTNRRLSFAVAGQGQHLLPPQRVIPMVQGAHAGGMSYIRLLPTLPEIGKQFEASASNLIQRPIDQLIAEYGHAPSSPKIKYQLFHPPMQQGRDFYLPTPQSRYFTAKHLEIPERALRDDSLLVLGEQARKKKLFLKFKQSAQLFTVGKKRLLTNKQLLLSKKIYYKKYNKIIRIPRQKKPIKIPMGAKIGKICIKGSYNNIILTLTDQSGDTKGWVSAGTAGFKNGRKSSHFASESAADRMAHRSIELGYAFAVVKMKGVGGCKKKAIRRLCKSNLQLLRMSDTFAIAHNGCRRARKPRK